MRAEGFGGSLRVVTEWTTRHRRSERAEVSDNTQAAASPWHRAPDVGAA